MVTYQTHDLKLVGSIPAPNISIFIFQRKILKFKLSFYNL